jgi:excinuclease ABC subunit A
MTRTRSATADYIVDMGPGAGVHGGEIVARGSLADILKAEGSLTADYLTGTREIEVPKKRRKGNGKKLTVHGARANNLRDVTASIPLGTFTCVTGVSGSGKSSFTIDTLYAAAARRSTARGSSPGRTTRIDRAGISATR